jgi:hypothetical protein
MVLELVTLIAAIGVIYVVVKLGGLGSLLLKEARRKADAAAEAARREELSRTEPGGAPDRPIDVVSPSEVEVRARSIPCSRCGGDVRLEEHLAVTIDGRRLRAARVGCAYCGFSRAVYFRIAE